MEFEIKDGIPIPRPVGKPLKYDLPLKDMGKVMDALKERFPGSMDFGKASAMVKERLG